MLEEFERIARESWEQQKTPLEKMYDSWMGEKNWETPPPVTTYRIFSGRDIEWRGHYVLAGEPFPCHLCGSTEDWVPEGNEAGQKPRVFVCEHEPVHIVGGAVRRISSVPARLVASFEEIPAKPE